jgi:hypothetical protein
MGEIIKPRRAWAGLVPAQTKKQIEEKKKKKGKEGAQMGWLLSAQPVGIRTGPYI